MDPETEYYYYNELNMTEENFTYFDNSTHLNRFYFYKTEQITFLWILFALIVIGNSFVLGAIQLSKTGGRRSRSRMNFFITHLAIADLMSGLVSVLMDIIWKMTVHWYAGNIMCKLARFMQAVVTFASTYVLVALSIDRLDAIAWPLHFTNSSYRAKLLIYLAWGFSMLFSLPMLFITSELKLKGFPQCWIDLPEAWHWKVYMTLVTLALFVLPALIIILCYAVIIRVIWSQGRVMQTPKQTQMTKNAANEKVQLKVTINIANYSSRSLIPQAKIRTIKMTFIIVLVFVICWSPYMIFDLLHVYGHLQESQRTVAISTFVNSLAPLNSAANPIIYGIFSTRICQNLRNIPCINRFYCNGELQSRRFITANNASWTSHSHVTKTLTTQANYGTNADRKRTNIPLVKKELSVKDNSIILKHLPVKDTEPLSGVETGQYKTPQDV